MLFEGLFVVRTGKCNELDSGQKPARWLVNVCRIYSELVDQGKKGGLGWPRLDRLDRVRQPTLQTLVGLPLHAYQSTLLYFALPYLHHTHKAQFHCTSH